MSKEIDELIDLIHKAIDRKIFNKDNLNDSFYKLGIDSIENMNIIFEIQEKFNIEKISDEDYNRLTSLSKIIEYLENIKEN